MIDKQKAASFLALCRKSEKPVVVVHTHPDGDAVGCGSAMVSFLSDVLGKDATLVLPDSRPESLAFLDGTCRTVDASVDRGVALACLENSDCLIIMDMNSADRSGALSDAVASCTAPKVLIDHHLNPKLEEFFLAFTSTDVSSASEVAYWLLRAALGEAGLASLPMAALRALMTGMTTDTNNFANSVFPSTLRMASELISMGVDRDEILSYLYNNYRENRLRALGFMLSERMTITREGVAYVVLSRQDCARFDLQDGETEGFVNMPLSISQVRMSLLLKEDDGYLRVSIRSKKGVSANAYARECFHGGGHENASGGRLYFPEDVASVSDAGKYIEDTSARFVIGADKR